MSRKPTKDGRINKSEASLSRHPSELQQPSIDSFHTALDTITESVDSFHTARTHPEPSDVDVRPHTSFSQDPTSTRTIASLVSIPEEREEQLDDASAPEQEDDESKIKEKASTIEDQEDDVVKIKEKASTTENQEDDVVKTKMKSSLSPAKEREEQLGEASDKDHDEDEKTHIHFKEKVDSIISMPSDQTTATRSTASMRLPSTKTDRSNISVESDHIESLTQVERLQRVPEPTLSNNDGIGEIRQPFLSDTDSMADSLADLRAQLNQRKPYTIPSPLHAGLDSKSMHSLKSGFQHPYGSGHSLRSYAPLGGGHAFIYMVIPPDGGYGWVITFISFLSQVVVDGIIFGIGIVLPDMAHNLNVQASSIALVASMQIGPISCAFINKYGFRPVALMGAVIAIVAILIASFSPNLLMLIFFYSLIGGVSLSMVWVSSQLIIGYYFEKYRPIANGLSCAGAGAGILSFSAMNSALVSEIGWRNVLRVHLIFLVLVFFMSITYVEVPPRKIGQIFEPAVESTTESSEGDEMREHRYSKTFSVYSAKIEEQGIGDLIENYQTYKEPGIFERYCGRCCPIRSVRPSSTAEIETKRYIIRTDPLEKQDLYYTGPAEYDKNRDELIQDVVEGKQVEFTGGMRKNARSVNYTLSMMYSSRDKDGVKQRQSKGSAGLRKLLPKYWLPKKVVNAFKVLFDVRLLRMMEFQVLLASAFFYPMGFNIPFVYSKVRAELPTQQTSLISPAIGLSNFTFRIASGFIAYKYREYTTYICGGGIAFGGLAVLISAFYGADVFWFQMIYAVCFGIAPAFYSTLRAIIYVRALGLDKLTNAFGLTGMAMGTGVFIGTTLAGYLNQATGSFMAAFCFGGTCMIIAGVLKLILPTLIKWQKARLELKQPKVQFSLSS